LPVGLDEVLSETAIRPYRKGFAAYIAKCAAKAMKKA
jgi:hypothetical protein